MSTNTAYLHHCRTSSGSKKHIVRSARPGLPKSFSSGRLHRGSKSKSIISIQSEEDIDTVTAFHQFCTTCEKQIPNPSNSILYCSELCRRRDSQQTSFASGSSSSCPSPTAPLTEYEAFIGRPLISRRNYSSAHLFTSEVLHDGKADMDPTEWKPDGSVASSIGSDGGSAVTKATANPVFAATTGAEDGGLSRTHSEAYLYLAQFHRSSESFAATSTRRLPRKRRAVPARSAASLTMMAPNSSQTSLASVGSDDDDSLSTRSSSSGSSSVASGSKAPTAASSAAPSVFVSSSRDSKA